MSRVRVPPNPNYIAEVVVLLTSLGAKRSELNAGRLACDLLEIKRVHRKVIDFNLDARAGRDNGEEQALERLEARNKALRNEDGELPLPQIFVDGSFLGDTVDLQALEDDGLLGRILRRQLCLKCHRAKASKAMTCQSCGAEFEEVLPENMTIQEELRNHYSVYGKADLEEEDSDSGSEAGERLSAYEAALEVPSRPPQPPPWEEAKKAARAKAAARGKPGAAPDLPPEPAHAASHEEAEPGHPGGQEEAEQAHPGGHDEEGAAGNRVHGAPAEADSAPAAAPAAAADGAPAPEAPTHSEAAPTHNEAAPTHSEAAPPHSKAAVHGAPAAALPRTAAAPPRPAAPAPKRLPSLQGYLWKRSPNQLRLRSYEKRYFVLKNMELCWWKSKQDALAEDFRGRSQLCKGFIDMTVGAVEVELMLGNESTFSLRPRGGTWAPGAIAKGDTGRAFTLDATDSEHTRDVWLGAIREHIQQAKRVAPKSADSSVADGSFYSAVGIPLPPGSSQ